MESGDVHSDRLSYEIFSILESKFLFGNDRPEPIPAPARRGKVRVLSIDAGLSLRDALLAASSLALLHRALPAEPFPHLFDVAAGSGLGGLLVSLLFSSRAAPADLPRLLSLRRDLLWPPPPPRCWPLRRRPPAAERWLRELFGESLTLKDAVRPVLVACYDVTGSSPMLFSRADAVESARFDFPLWEVCRATLAEPDRFEPAPIRSIDGSKRFVAVDGGLALANPTAAAITHVLNNKQEFPFVRGVEDLLVLSLGRGPGPDQTPKYRARDWARPIRDITGYASAETVNHAVGMAFANARVRGNYLRVQADQVSSTQGSIKEATTAALAELEMKNVESAMFGGQRIGECTNRELLEQFAKELMLEYRQRDSRIAPTVVFKQAVPPPMPGGSGRR